MRKRTKLLLTALVLLTLIPLLMGVVVYVYGQSETAQPADVIIVLGAGTRPSGRPSASHERRIRHAYSLYQQGYAPYLLCTGGYTQNHPESEGGACAKLLLSLGAPQAAILMEEVSRSTEENAIEAKKVMDERGFKTAILVSDNYHLFRASLLFHVYSMDVSVSAAQLTSGPLHWSAVLRNVLREIAALAWYFFKSAFNIPITDF